jgi:glycosyltransferase involved in cell wall biosynthesis
VRLISPQDGPLRAAFADAGVGVTLVDTSALHTARSDDDFAAALENLAAQPHWTDTDVLVANTVVSAWAVHLAARLRKPCLFYVHESVSVRRFFALQLAKPAIARIEQSFALATRVVFIAAAAQRAHAVLNQRRNFRVLPGWIDVARIRAYVTTHDRTALRRELGLADHAVVFACIGSLLPRKGQHVFLEAIARLPAPAPAGTPFVFLLVGGQAAIDPYADLLRARAAKLSGADIRFIGHTAEPFRFFHAADIFVCSSLEEALPRVVLEAAAFGRHVVTTDVDGIPEIVGPEEAWLVPPDDADCLAEAMLTAADAHRRGDFSRARRAQAAVAARFDTAVLLPRHADLIRAVAGLSAC